MKPILVIPAVAGDFQNPFPTVLYGNGSASTLIHKCNFCNLISGSFWESIVSHLYTNDASRKAEGGQP